MLDEPREKAKHEAPLSVNQQTESGIFHPDFICFSSLILSPYFVTIKVAGVRLPAHLLLGCYERRFSGAAAHFLFGLKLSNEFNRFLNCGGLAFYKLG